MTLRIRNRILLLFLFASVMFTMAVASLFIFAFATGKIVPPLEILRFFSFRNSPRFILRYDFWATVFSAFFFLLYTVITLFLIFFRFEKTQSPEIFYFCGFLISCLLEGSRILIPFFGLWQTYSSTLLFIGRLILFGKFLAPMSILFTTLFSNTDQQQDAEKHFVVTIIAGAIISLLLPLNTSSISSVNTVRWGFPKMFFVLRATIFAVAILSATLKIFAKTNLSSSKILTRQALSISLLSLGYALLTCADNYLLLAMGIALLFTPTIFFLRDTHRLYI